MNIRIVWLTITARCNNKCNFCYYKTNNQEMDYNKVKKYLNLIDKIHPSKLVIIGGEPTLHKDFNKILNLLKSKKYNKVLVSNGFGFQNKAISDKIIKTFDNIALSVEGTQELHNKITNNKNAHKSLFIAIKMANKKKLNTNMVITKENISNIYDNIKEQYLFGVKRFGFNMGTSLARDKTMFTPKEFIHIFSKKLRILLKDFKEAKFSVVTPLPMCIVPKDLRKHFHYGCHMFSSSGLIIDVGGNILPCTHYVDYPIANISSGVSFDSFQKAWKKTEKNRKQLSYYPLEKCNCCKYKNVCFGGCPVIWKVYSSKEII